MSKDKDLRNQLLELQVKQTQAQIDAANKAMQPDPNLQKLIGLNNSIVDWSTGANGLKDIYKHPTLANKLPVYQLAMSNRDAARVGKGVNSINAGSSGGDVGYGADLAKEDNFRRNMIASGTLENSLDGELNSAQNNLAALTGQQANTNLAGGGLSAQTGSQLGSMIGRLDQRIGSGGFWGSLGKGLLKYGLPIASGALTGGLGTGIGAIASKFISPGSAGVQEPIDRSGVTTYGGVPY